MNDKIYRKPSKFTARELLERVAGEDHALHSVIKVTEPKRGPILFWCSCSAMCSVEPTEENRAALRNVGGEGFV